MSFAPCSGKHVLVVEDNLPYANVTCDFLKQEGMETAIASNTAETLSAMEKRQADIVLLDIHLGGEDGLTFLPELKKRYPKVPVVVLTGLGYDTAMIKTAIENGASTYFSKENDLQDLIGLLARLLSTQGPADERTVS
jgi:DNA-binding response OmpR family regulator